LTAELRVLGVRVHVVSMSEAVARVSEAIAAARSGAPPLHVVTINPEFVMRARRDPVFAAVLEQAQLCLPDGVGIVWAARLTGVRLERVPGVDFIGALAPVAARAGWRMFLLGGAPGVAGEAGAALQAAHAGLRIAGAWAGSPDPAGDEESCLRIRLASPDLLFVAYGAPAQDAWIARNLARLGVPVAAGVGGAFDFIAGRAPRAPVWARRAGLEWAHRLVHQPWRARRMLALPRFAVAVLRERRRAARDPHPVR